MLFNSRGVAPAAGHFYLPGHHGLPLAGRRGIHLCVVGLPPAVVFFCLYSGQHHPGVFGLQGDQQGVCHAEQDQAQGLVLY